LFNPQATAKRATFLMNSVFLVLECSDPYEPDGTLAVCTSEDVAKRLFPRRLWKHVERKNLGPTFPGSSYNREIDIYVDLITGKTKEDSSDGTSRPNPRIEEVELDVKL
jgi:hypothetical protein